MKNWTLMLTLFGILLLWRCTESPVLVGPIDPPVPEEKKSTVSASADFGVILDPYGDSTTKKGDSILYSFTFGIDRSKKSVKVNENPVSPYPNRLYRVIDENHIMIKANEDTVSLRVESISNDSIYIMAYKWYLNSMIQKNSSLEYTGWEPMTPDSVLFARYHSYTLDNYLIFAPDIENGRFLMPHKWSLNNKVLTISDANSEPKNYNVIVLNKDSLTLEDVDGIVTQRTTYTHFQIK